MKDDDAQPRFLMRTLSLFPGHPAHAQHAAHLERHYRAARMHMTEDEAANAAAEESKHSAARIHQKVMAELSPAEIKQQLDEKNREQQILAKRPPQACTVEANKSAFFSFNESPDDSAAGCLAPLEIAPSS